MIIFFFESLVKKIDGFSFNVTKFDFFRIVISTTPAITFCPHLTTDMSSSGTQRPASVKTGKTSF
jgi:hypothetical protein